MSATLTEDAIHELIRSLWDLSPSDPMYGLLPRDPDSLRDYYPRLREFVDSAPRVNRGRVDPDAMVRGEIVASGEGSFIEGGAVIHESCRLILGAGSTIRTGAVLRDEVVVGPDCLIGVHCEVVRSVILGPRTYLGHLVYMADSIVGREVNVAGHVMFANTPVKRKTVRLRYRGETVDSGRSHLGALVGDEVRFGASIDLSPGCVVLPGLRLPPKVLLLGTIDSARRDELMKRFFELWGDEKHPG